MPLSRRSLPFDHPEWVFELKYDGFRSRAVLHGGRCELIARWMELCQQASVEQDSKKLAKLIAGITRLLGEK